MKKIKNKKLFRKLCMQKFLIVFFTFYLNNTLLFASNFEYTHNLENINISKKIYERLLEYNSGNFYSPVYQKKFTQTKGMYFSLSKSGTVTAFSFCEDDMLGCVSNLVKYQTLKTCERISKEACYIIAIGNNLVINKKKIAMDNENNFKKIFEVNSDKIQVKSYEIRGVTLREFENSEQIE